jgi:ribosomal protein S27E
MPKKQRTPTTSPFQVKCPHCGTIAKSWHHSTKYMPKGETRGVAWCECGRTGADSAGVKGVGRVIEG